MGYSQFSEIKTLKIKYIEPGKLIIKPNPSSEKVIIEFNSGNLSVYELVITDNTGNRVFVKEGFTENSFELNTNSFNAGTYYVTLREEGGKLFKEKLVIQK